MSLSEAVLLLDALDIETEQMIQQQATAPVLEAASLLIDRHYLRALDAVQLSSAIVARNLLAAPDMRFIASDKALLDAAKAEGFDIWNPAI